MKELVGLLDQTKKAFAQLGCMPTVPVGEQSDPHRRQKEITRLVRSVSADANLQSHRLRQTLAQPLDKNCDV
jgi:hypothetical protein